MGVEPVHRDSITEPLSQAQEVLPCPSRLSKLISEPFMTKSTFLQTDWSKLGRGALAVGRMGIIRAVGLRTMLPCAYF